MFKAAREQFEIDNLLPEQGNSLCEFVEGQNIFVNLPTGYGKFLIFQYLPIAANALFDKPRGSSILVVISPLRPLMEDQILWRGRTKINDTRDKKQHNLQHLIKHSRARRNNKNASSQHVCGIFQTFSLHS